MYSSIRWRWVVSTTPRPLYPREGHGTHCIVGWVSPRAGLDGCGKISPNRDSIPGLSSPWRVAIPTELSRPLPQIENKLQYWNIHRTFLIHLLSCLYLENISGIKIFFKMCKFEPHKAIQRSDGAVTTEETNHALQRLYDAVIRDCTH